jgi:hypothetical protein
VNVPQKRTRHKPHWSEALADLGVCSTAFEWARRQSSARAAWPACERPDWMFWILRRLAQTDTDREQIVLCVCAFVRVFAALHPGGGGASSHCDRNNSQVGMRGNGSGGGRPRLLWCPGGLQELPRPCLHRSPLHHLYFQCCHLLPRRFHCSRPRPRRLHHL